MNEICTGRMQEGLASAAPSTEVGVKGFWRDVAAQRGRGSYHNDNQVGSGTGQLADDL